MQEFFNSNEMQSQLLVTWRREAAKGIKPVNDKCTWKGRGEGGK